MYSKVLGIIVALQLHFIEKCWAGRKRIMKERKGETNLWAFIMSGLIIRWKSLFLLKKIQEARLLPILQPSADSLWHIFSMKYINK